MCSGASGSEEYRARLRDDSPLAAPELDIPHGVDFVWGERDCLGIAVAGRRFAQVLSERGNTVRTRVVPETGHQVYATPQGVEALTEVVSGGCR